MILAEKIAEERKRNGWSQEDLAEKLEVSRQSVSKWEGAQAIPDLGRIVEMAKLFGVSTDYLLKDDETRNGVEPKVEVESGRKTKVLSFEEAGELLKTKEKNAPEEANAVSLCILSPALLIFLAGLSEEVRFLSEAAAAGIGVIVLLLMVALAVSIFIRKDSETEDFKWLEKEDFETAYGVDSLVGEKRKEFAPRRTNAITLGVTLCILSVVPLLASAFMGLKDVLVVASVSLLLIIVSIGVNMIVRSEIIWNTYSLILQKDEYTADKKEKNAKSEKLMSVYWMFVTAAYLGWSFLSMRWDITWVVWPVAAVLSPAIRALILLIS